MDRAAAESVTGGGDELPATPLWVARLRNPFALALVDATGARYEAGAGARVIFWPAVLDADLAKLADGMARALFREFDMFPGDWPAPEIVAEIIEPPRFILAVQPDTEREWVLEPRAPRLWRVRDEGSGVNSVEWWRGFGVEPEFPADTRAVEKFLAGREGK
jgi:hypothetical protein